LNRFENLRRLGAELRLRIVRSSAFETRRPVPIPIAANEQRPFSPWSLFCR
jgi:hypothetical protein